MLALLAVVYNAVLIPLRLAFDLPYTSYLIAADCAADLALIVDFLWRSSHKSRLAPEYAFSDDLEAVRPWDAVACVPMDLILLVLGVPAQSIYLPLLRLTRFIRLDMLFQQIRLWARIYPHSAPSFRMLRVAVVVLLLSHFFACGWFAIGSYEGAESWVASEGILEASLASQYLHSIYWAFQTITTVGYGDIPPVTDLEMAYSLVVVIAGVLVWAYVIGTVSWLIANRDYMGMIYRQKVNKVSQFLRQNEVPGDLRRKVNGYYDYLWSRNLIVDEREVLSDLPNSLRTQVALFLNQDVIQRVPYLRDAEKGFIRTLSTLLRPQIFCPGDLIIHRGEIGHEMYFIFKGEVDILGEGDAILKSCGQGEFFGEQALLLQCQRTASARAKTFCELYVLKARDFDEVLSHYPSFADRLHGEGKKWATPRDPMKDEELSPV